VSTHYYHIRTHNPRVYSLPIGLCASLARLDRFSRGKLPLYTFWPRCYSLASASDEQKFEYDFGLSAALVTLKRYALDQGGRTGESGSSEKSQVEHALSLWLTRIEQGETGETPKINPKSRAEAVLMARVQRTIDFARQDKDMQATPHCNRTVIALLTPTPNPAGCA